MMDSIETFESELKITYDDLRLHAAPSQDVRRKIDACIAVTEDLLGLMRIRLTEDDFNAETEKMRLHMLYDKDYAKSIYGSTISTVPSKCCSHNSGSSSISAKRADAAAQLAAKKAEIEMEAAIDAQRQQLKRLENQRDIEIMEAKLRVYAEEETKENKDRCRSVYSGKTDPYPPASLTGQSDQQSITALAQAIHDTMVLTRLPAPEPTVFSGDPLKFVEWSTSFKSLIERRCSSPADKLFYLQKYITGEAKLALEGCFYRKDEEAYKQAWDKLNSRYGHSFVLQRAFREKLNKWPKIGSKEYIKLREYGDFLQACDNAMPHIKGLQVLNDCEENQKMLLKLPDWVTSRWNRYVTDQLDQDKDYPSFKEFAAFVSKEAKIACNPVSSLHAIKPLEEKPTRDTRHAKADTLAINVMAKCNDVNQTRPIDSDKPEKENMQVNNTSPVKCIFCGEDHSLYQCQRLTEKSVEEKKRFVYDNQLCFACLRKGHNSKDCKRKATCAICKRHHPTPLHEDRSSVGKVTIHGAPQSEENASALSCCVDGSESSSTSMIVPVWISSHNMAGKETLAYALLDTQSSNTFVDLEVCEKLQATMEPVKLKLSTMMGRDSIVKSQRVTGLRVRGFSSDILFDLPPAYAKDCIPLERAHIPTCETANKWNHLAVISHEVPPLMDCGVGLLIGYDCSRAFVPRQIITGNDYEPYAIKTDLGWSIVGSSQSLYPKQVKGLCHRVSVKEIPPVTPITVIKVLESDCANTSPGEKTISLEDITFLHILKEGIKQNENGHLEMPPPFKVRPHLPDNEKLALVRLKHLKRKLERDPKLKNDYVRFMEGILQDGNAKKVDHQPEVGKVWYIPHQVVYRPNKPDKIRVGFDCSEKYEGVALNDHLLTGSDLTNGLTGVLCRFHKHPIAVKCDIEKIFHRFHVHEEDRNFLRLLLWRKGDTNLEPTEYCMKVHLFGATLSPGCANYGMKYLTSQNESEHPSAENFIRKKCYVDDGHIRLESADAAIELMKEAQALCSKKLLPSQICLK
ncbi:uncharacterized protein [Hyperolius riggenbachi]|uniref:uncharacterized protein n=1 Tax=Hyperolius riggenbachi TaxID=752182 RepID=UPI0035A27706